MNRIDEFKQEVSANIEGLSKDKDLQGLSKIWIREISPHKYSYNFSWMGRPIIQFPQDMVATQEIIMAVKPDLIIETGIAHGGSLCLSASMLALLDYNDAVANGTTLDPRKPTRRVLGIDIDIRHHNREAIEAHSMASRIDMIEGSSIEPTVIAEVRDMAGGFETVLVFLDSNHSHEHVLAELNAYAPLVSVDSYCVVFDTIIEDMPAGMFPDRPWDKGDNAKTAVWEYLQQLQSKQINAVDGRPLMLEVDHSIEDKLLISVAPDGYLKRTS